MFFFLTVSSISSDARYSLNDRNHFSHSTRNNDLSIASHRNGFISDIISFVPKKQNIYAFYQGAVPLDVLYQHTYAQFNALSISQFNVMSIPQFNVLSISQFNVLKIFTIVLFQYHNLMC